MASKREDGIGDAVPVSGDGDGVNTMETQRGQHWDMDPTDAGHQRAGHNDGDDDMLPTAPASKPRFRKPLAFYMSFLALNIMAFICALDATVLGVALPSIAHELGGSTLEGFWSTIAFVLAVVIVQPIYTSASNVFGRLPALYTSFVLFIVGSVVFAVARNMSILILGRVFQGLGAGGLDVLNEIILADITTLKERPMYLGVFAIPMLAGTVLGPVLGGLFAQNVDWRWIGWINLPISTLGLLLVFFFLRLKPVEQSLRQQLRRMDWIGLALFTAGCTLFASPLAWAGAMYPWASYQTLVPFFIGISLLVLFALYERRPDEPVFPPRLFHGRTACLTLAAGFLHGVANYPIALYVPLLLQALYQHAPLRAAVLQLPGVFFSIASAVAASVLVEVLRAYRLTLLASWAILAVGAGALTLLDARSSLAAKESFQVLVGLGIGPFWSVLNLPMQASMRRVDDVGLATGLLVSFRLFGGLVGLALSSSVFSSIYERRVAALRGALPDALAFLGDAREAVASIAVLRDAQIPPQLLAPLVEAYRQALFGVFWMIAGAAVLGFAASCFIEEISLETEELGRQRLEGKEEKVPLDRRGDGA